MTGFAADAAAITAHYLHALGLQRQAPDLALLTEITRRHVAQFAFSSVGTRLGDDLPLDMAALYQRIVVQRRGGYCFEHNGLVHDVLAELGFTVRLSLGRVIYNQATHPGLTHRVTLVDCEQSRFLVDVGFGPLGPGRPVNWAGNTLSPTARNFRIAEPSPGEFHLQIQKDDGFFSLYRFELARYGQADCELGHFFSHKHPKAAFVNNLVVSRIFDAEVRSLRNRDYRILSAEGEQETAITSAAQLHRILVDDFGLAVSEAESLRLYG